MILGILKDIHTAKSFFLAEVLANNGHQEVEVLLVFQVLHLLCELVKFKYKMIQFHT